MLMQNELLQISQYVIKHPIIIENESYKKRYINTLEYFVRKYCSNNKYSFSILELYKDKLLQNKENYDYVDEELKKISKGVMTWKMKKI